MLLDLPDEETQIKIRKALNEDVKLRENHLETLKTWLRQQPHLPDSWDDVCLMNFLRGTSFSLEKCKRKLDMYFTMRAMVPEVFSNRDISRQELREILGKGNLVTMPGMTPDGLRLSISAPVRRDVEVRKDFADFCKVISMLADLRLKVDTCGAAGEIGIFDCNFDTRKHFVGISVPIVKKCLTCAQEAYPFKIKQIHIVNVDSFYDYVFAIFKPFIKEKLRQRIYLHSKLESLHEYVPKNMLPEEYGGTAGKLEMHKVNWREALKEHTAWFKEQENLKADEKRRPGKPHTQEDLFGLDGSFRQLNID